MKLLKTLSATLLLSAMTALVSNAQPTATSYPLDQIGGRTYLILFPDTTTTIEDERRPEWRSEAFELMIYSATTQDVEVGRPGGTASSVRVPAGRVVTFDAARLDGGMILSEMNEPTAAGTIVVRAVDPILLYAYMMTGGGTAAVAPLPIEAWGTEYLAATWPEGVVRNIYPLGAATVDWSQSRAAPAELVVIAAYDNTEVVIDPTDELAGCLDCERVTLRAGEAYQVQSRGDTLNPRDIAGTRITASKPIGVIAANSRFESDFFDGHGFAQNSAKDLTSEWLRPINLHGTEFVFLPFMDDREVWGVEEWNRQAENVRVFPSAGATGLTKMTEEGSADFGGEKRGSGEFFSDSITDTGQAFLYRTSSKAQAFQVPDGVISYFTVTTTDLFPAHRFVTWGTDMVEMMPRERWTSFAPFRTPAGSEEVMRHYLNIVTEEKNAGLVTIRSNIRDTTTSITFDRMVPGSTLRWTTLELEGEKTYLLESPDSVRFSGFVYGFERGEEIWDPTDSTDNSEKPFAEYSDYLARTYAFPLPGLRGESTALPNTLRVDSVHRGPEWKCHHFDVTVTTEDLLIHGIEYFRLDREASTNVIVHRDWDWPEDSLKFVETGSLAMFLFPIEERDPMRIVLRYRQNHPDATEETIAYNYIPPALSYPYRGIGIASAVAPVDTSLVLRNDTPSPIDLITLTLKRDTYNAWEILGTTPWSEYDNDLSGEPIAPGDSVIVHLRYRPNEHEYNGAYLVVETPCFFDELNLSASRGPTLGVEEEGGVVPPEELDLTLRSILRSTPASSSATSPRPRSANDRGRRPTATASHPAPSGPTR